MPRAGTSHVALMLAFSLLLLDCGNSDGGTDGANDAGAEAGCTDEAPICGQTTQSVCVYEPDDPASGCTLGSDPGGWCPSFEPRMFTCVQGVPLRCCMNPGIAPAPGNSTVYRCCQ